MSSDDPGIRPPAGDGASDQVTAAIEEAWDAARAAGLSPSSLDDHELDPGRKISYAFELTGLDSAPDVADLEESLESIEGVRARIVYPSATAYVTAPETVPLADLAALMAEAGVSAVLIDSTLRRRLFTPHQLQDRAEAQLRDAARLRTMPGRTRRHLAEESRALSRARAAGFFDDRQDRLRAEQSGDENVLYTARELISPWRLLIAVILTLPVIALSYVPALQFGGWQWVALALATPVVTWSAWPFHRALAGGVRRGITALDGASSVAVLVAYLWSLGVLVFTTAGRIGWTSVPTWFPFEHHPVADGELFLDVACVMTAVLLAARRGTMRNRASLLEEMEARRPDPHTMVMMEKPRRIGPGLAPGDKSNTTPEQVPLGEVNVGDDIVVGAGQIIPVDGSIVGGSCRISPSLVSAGAVEGDEVKVGSYVFAGTKNRDGRIKIRVARTGHQTRIAAVDRWLEEANRRQHRATMLSTKTASFLIPAAVTLAALDFVLWYLFTGNLNASIATALAVLASVAPVALALSTSVAIRHGIESAARSGIMVRDGATLRRLQEVDTVVFNRLGTLTTNEVSVESVVAEHGENPELVLRVAAALAMSSDHPTSQAMVKAARASRDRDDDEGAVQVPHWIDVSHTEIADDGTFTGYVELPVTDKDGAVSKRQVQAQLWRPRTLSDLPGRLAAAAMGGGGTPFVVAWQGIDRGAITLVDNARRDAEDGIELLHDQGVETVMISRDAYPVARRFADRLHIDRVLAGIAPADKTKAVRAVHTRGATVAMVGDHSVLPTMKAADVGILIGETESLDLNTESAHDGVTVVVLLDEVSAIGHLLAHSRRVCRIIDRNIMFSWAYNILAIVASVAGVLNPMVATLLMVGSSWVVEKRSRRARMFPRLG